MAAQLGYDAFLSYSHRHDAALGPALQTSVERFAKPWYRMRALRIFRDTANLAANPALWTSVEDALKSSQWFILLASDDAASSEWVNREVQWWRAHCSPDRILVVGTSPGLAWDQQEQDWAANAPVPPSLRGAFGQEPLWVDLSDIQPDDGKLIIPADRIASVAATIRGVQKDMLIGEHLQQHRQAMHLAEMVVAVLALLTSAAVVASLIAIGQRNTAIEQRNQAIANDITIAADQLTATDPSLAAQFDIAANQYSPTPDTATRLVNAAATPLARQLTGPQGQIDSVAFSPDGGVLAVGNQYGQIWLWNLTNPARPVRLSHPLTGPGDAVESLRFSPDGTTLAAGSAVLTARNVTSGVWLWTLANPDRPLPLGRLMADPGVIRSVAFSPNGKILAAAGSDAEVWLWNITNTSRPVRFRKLPTDQHNGNGLNAVAFSPDGKTLAAGNDDRKVWLWNMSDPAHPAQLTNPLTGPGGNVGSLAFSPDGKTLAAGSGNGRVWLWNMSDPAHPAQLTNPLTGPGGNVGSLAFSPDGKTLAAGSGNGRVWLWNMSDPAHPAQLTNPLTGPADSIFSVAFSPHGHTLVTGSSNNTLQLWTLPASALTGPIHDIGTVAFSPNGHILAAGTNDGQVWLWNMTEPAHPRQQGDPLTGPDNIDSLTFSPNGHTLAGGTGDGQVWLWNLTNPARPARLSEPLKLHTGEIDSVSFSPDGRTLAAGGDNAKFSMTGGKVWLWSVVDPARPIQLGQPLTDSGGAVDSVAFSPDGHTLAGAGNVETPSSTGGRVWLWNLASPDNPSQLGQPLTAKKAANFSWMAFSPDGKTLAVAGNTPDGDLGGTVWLWKLANRAHPARLGQPLPIGVATVNSLAFSPDGRTLGIGGAISTDGADSGRIWLWNMTDPAHPAELGQPLNSPINMNSDLNQIDAITFSPDGKAIVGSIDNTAQIWNLDIDNAIQRICAATTKSLTDKQWRQYLPRIPFSVSCGRYGHYGRLNS